MTTDVLVIGSGPAGSSAALFLAGLGVDHLVITKYRWTADTPRAHITNQRTVEILRDQGVEADVVAEGTPSHLMGDTVFCTALAGDELGRVRTWGTHPARRADYTLASPSSHCDLPQNILEPILVGRAAERGSRIRFDTEYLHHVQDDDGVTVTARDRITGAELTIRARYVIGADGGRSAVARDAGLPFDGRGELAGSMNIVFDADLTALVEHRPSVLYWVLQPGADVGGIGMGVLRMVRPWTRWMAIWGYDLAGPPPELDDAAATAIVHDLIGDDSVPVTIRSTSVWTVNEQWATRYRSGRVFCAGDAVHRHPPSNGLGSNTSIQDSYNLCWKLAMVLRGTAGPGLLDSYDAERAPVGEQIVRRANRSVEEFGPIFAALGLEPGADPAAMRASMAARADDTPPGPRPARRCGRRWSTRTTSSTRTVSRWDSATRPARWCPTAPRSPHTTATPSSTTTRRPGRGRGCRTAGWAATGTASPPTTSQARAGSRCSPASRAEHGPRPRGPSRPSWGSSWPHT
ncbi:FAD-binding monooxygenase, PheA/TfdB family, similarity to 2,4-dichlorophenol 6-monooxygenase [Pseudonocardia sp. Ae717_Ps2]|nr:FAD-binding monooxygenase, PheA/TfdB family, similarity to 2,4-dichlorophenol 6-monooxygenase [Pseudonocardia sp. Ae717_Ps2]